MPGNAYQARVVRIGNSQGVRIPKPLLDQAGLRGQVEITVDDGQLIIRPARPARAGWSERLQDMAQGGDDCLLDADAADLCGWDEEQWQW